MIWATLDADPPAAAGEAEEEQEEQEEEAEESSLLAIMKKAVTWAVVAEKMAEKTLFPMDAVMKLINMNGVMGMVAKNECKTRIKMVNNRWGPAEAAAAATKAATNAKNNLAEAVNISTTNEIEKMTREMEEEVDEAAAKAGVELAGMEVVTVAMDNDDKLTDKKIQNAIDKLIMAQLVLKTAKLVKLKMNDIQNFVNDVIIEKNSTHIVGANKNKKKSKKARKLRMGQFPHKRKTKRRYSRIKRFPHKRYSRTKKFSHKRR